LLQGREVRRERLEHAVGAERRRLDRRVCRQSGVRRVGESWLTNVRLRVRAIHVGSRPTTSALGTIDTWRKCMKEALEDAIHALAIAPPLISSIRGPACPPPAALE
jgi:hypothetical protein